MANMGSITKFIQAFKTHFNRNRSRTTDEDEAQESPKELEGDASDQNPGDVRMNSGVHKRVYGVRRKIVGFTVIGLLLAFTMSYVFFQDDPGSKAPRRPNGSSVQETKTPSHAGETAAKDELSYRDLRALDQRNQGARVATAQPMDSDDPHVATRVNRGDPDVSPQTYSVAASPGGGVYSAPMSTPVPAPVASAANAALAAEKRAADELEKRFASAIDFALGRSGNSNAGGEAAVAGGAAQPSGEAPVIPASNTLQTANLSLSSGSPYVVQAGTLIPAMLFTGIDTAVPGQVTAQVSADVYDSLTRSNLLIPAGSRLLGTYKSDGSATNGRVNVVFSTLILPNGNAFDIGTSMVAVDGGGYSGIVGKVHRHTSRVIGAGMISSAIAALGSLASGNTSARDTYTGGQIAMQGALANLISTTSNMMSQGANVQPNITVEPGHTFQVYVVQPVAFGTP
ncbi:TrbI/VirB10 family protein [uncultured Selenomonas sp.]|uniref:TrbI/VirB10 family protein n=1 Tax=uncultured Selenomonas sp. TaxID=159275 RepID=UPI0028E47630|nr:TrbI/VirB10 family protein [uncultured Selenomonas sp.]